MRRIWVAVLAVDWWRYPPLPSKEPRMASGGPTAATSATPATRRSTRSTPRNFNKLEVAWRFKTDEPRSAPGIQPRSDAADGQRRPLYRRPGSRRAVVALDAATGEMLWMHSEKEGARGRRRSAQLSGRGLAYWTDGQRRAHSLRHARLPSDRAGRQDRRPDRRLRQERRRRSEAGRRPGDRSRSPARSGCTAAPVVAGDTRDRRRRASGRRRARRARQRERLRPRIRRARPASACGSSTPSRSPGEFGYNTWEKDSADYTGNTGVWGQISVDEELGMVYLPVELPTGDYYGGHRPGNGLFGESIVAVDLQNRPAEMALPVGASRHLGHGHPVRADAGRHHVEWPDGQSGGAADQARRSCTCSIA